MKRFFAAFAVLAVLGGAVFWILTIPHPVPAAVLKVALAGHQPDLKNGELLFHIGGQTRHHPGVHTRRRPAGQGSDAGQGVLGLLHA